MDLNDTKGYLSYTYTDGPEKIATSKYITGVEATVAKDSRGRVLKTTLCNRSLENTYIKDNLTKTVEKNNGTVVKNYDYTYDFDRVTEYSETDSGNTLAVSETYAYNDDGTLKSKAVTANGTTRNYGYNYKNAARNLESITVDKLKIVPQNDCLGRNTGKEIFVGDNKVAEEMISYRKVGDHATNMPSTVRFGDKVGDNYMLMDNLKYKYDNMGNISAVYENGELSAKYTYDALGRLIREDNKSLGKTYLYTYDNNGNILNKRTLSFTLRDNTLLEELDGVFIDYGYEGDKLMSYSGKAFAYDLLGNPTTYKGKALTWTNGRQLTKYDTTSFEYDAKGRRTKKGTVTYTYGSNGELLGQSNGLEFIYDHTGVMGVKYNGETYIYRKNVQGDVVALLDTSGNVVVKYIYDVWGNVTVVNNSSNNIGELNPIRYRSYYYDTETGLYYLKTRYYDPETCRFITIDDLSYIDPDTINGLNLYSYCGNNPVMRVDENGTKWWNPFTWDWNKIVGWVATVAVVALAITGIALIAVGTIASGGLLGAVVLGASIGALASIGGSIVVQGGLKNANPWTVLRAGLIGACIGAISGIMSYGMSTVGSVIGEHLGTVFGSATHISSGVVFGKIISSTILSSIGHFFGGIVGGIIGGTIGNYYANLIFGNKLRDEETIIEGIKGEIPSWIITSFRWLMKNV